MCAQYFACVLFFSRLLAIFSHFSTKLDLKTVTNSFTIKDYKKKLVYFTAKIMQINTSNLLQYRDKFYGQPVYANLIFFQKFLCHSR